MKIAFVSSGNSIHVKKIANALTERGHEITLFTLPNYNRLLPDFDQRVHIVKLPFSGKKGYYLNAPYLRKMLRKGKFDLVNSHYASGFGTLSRLTKVHPIALAVFGSDVYDYPLRSKSNKKRIIKNLRNADVITSTSNAMAEQVRSFYSNSKKIYVTPFGVDLSLFHPQKIEKADVFIFGIVKKIEYKYGIDILIQAYAVFCKRFPEVKSCLKIYGRGSAVGEYQRLAEKLNLSNLVHFEGFVANEKVPEILCKMDVACFPSVLDSESFGVAAVEAMACGVPVIVSDASGLKEVVEKDVTGFVVRKQSIDDLANAMEKVYCMTEKERKAMGRAGVNRVREKYDFNQNMDTYLSAISHAL